MSGLISSNTQAQVCGENEPAYCTPQVFRSLEKPITDRILRAHVFKVGQVTLAGLAIGVSSANSVKNLAMQNSTASDQEGYCTWYVNRGNVFAWWNFNYKYLPHPSSQASEQIISQYMSLAAPLFDQGMNNFVTCAQKHRYISVGCNGMKHRGPTLFGMLLAYSGCKASNATAIVNEFWGLNGVAPEVRLAIIEAASRLGKANQTQSCRLRQMLEN